MKQFQIIGLLCITAINLTFCAMKQELQMEFPQETQSVFYQKQKVGKGNGGIQFYIEFKKPLATNLKLAKIYFHNQESPVEEITKNSFVAHFYESDKKEDLILDIDSTKEYGNKAPMFQKSKFNLKHNEAVLEYKKENIIYFYKITNVLEKPVR